MQLIDIIPYLGRFHPLLVHLPIGFLLMAAVVDLAAHSERFRYLRNAVPFMLLLGFISAVLTCILGFMLAGGGDYDDVLLNRHKISGILLAVFSGCLYACSVPAVRSRLNIQPRLFSALSILMLLIMGYSGHQGGSLTHGSDFLSFADVWKEKREKPTSVAEALIFEDVIQPMLDKKCSQCHNSGKLKGGLSVQSLEKLLKGGKNGPSVTPGKLDNSELFHRITLDPSHEDFMPSDGKPPLTENETAIIRWWIEEAMTTDKNKIGELSPNDTIAAGIAVFLQLGEGGLALNPAVNPEIPLTADPAAIEKLRSKGFMVRVMLHEPVMLDITLPPRSGKEIIAGTREELATISKNIIWLNLAENSLTNADLDFLPLMQNVEKIRLEKNRITDGIDALVKDLQHLKALNLNETEITKQGVENIKQTSAIERIYSWKAGSEL